MAGAATHGMSCMSSCAAVMHAPAGLTNASERQLQRGGRRLHQMAPSRSILLSALSCAHKADLSCKRSTTRVMNRLSIMRCLAPDLA